MKRDVSIDIIKCMAAMLITYSHMGMLFPPPYAALSTGGAMGDVLFFFCSGYTLLLGRDDNGFFNWYKRRINRIYPTVFAWALMACVCFDLHVDFVYTLLWGGGWFVTCIMLYYVLFYFIRKFAFSRQSVETAVKRMWLVIALSVAAVLVWYWTMDREPGFNMYGQTIFKWCHYFLFMLAGAILGWLKRHKNMDAESCTGWRPGFLVSLLLMVGCVAMYYGMMMFRGKGWLYDELQILTLLPLLGFVYAMYVWCNTRQMVRLYNNRIAGFAVKAVGGLCLEIYLVQYNLFTDRLNDLFPLNIVIIFLLIVVAAYVLRCMARIWAQTFMEGNYDWKAVVKIV